MGRPETGRTGARFGAPARRARHTPDPDTAHGHPVGEPDEDVVAPEEAPAEVGVTGARFGGRTRTRRGRRTPAEPPTAEPATLAEPEDRPTEEIPRVDEGPAPAIAARPYVLTGGRTAVRVELRVETMVSALVAPDGEFGERRTVLTICRDPRSVSEVAALTKVPLGVARVLIDDLAAEGRVRVHLAPSAADGPSLEILDRVLSGLRRL